jgi:hypothetical protein
MTDVLDRANPSSCPFPTDAPHWTVVDDDVVVLGGRVPDLAAHLECQARAAEIVGDGQVLCDLEIVPSVARSGGALVVIDAITFEAGTARLTRSSRDAFLALTAHAPGFAEVLAWIVAPDDGRCTALEAAELSRRRVAVIHRSVEEGTELVAFVRVEQRDADLTTQRGPKQPPRRRYALRIRPI